MSTYLIRIFAAILLLSVAVANSSAQSASDTQGQQGVLLTTLFQPVYPPLARQTRIIGDVELTLEVRQDGSLESVNVVRGHPLLQQAAVDSAKQSRFACQKCGDGTWSYHMVYSFQLIGGESCCAAVEANVNAQTQDQPIPRVIQSANHVTVVDRPTCICDPAADTVKVRSMKCLYLWKCAVHFL
jgi:TonB family protein